MSFGRETAMPFSAVVFAAGISLPQRARSFGIFGVQYQFVTWFGRVCQRFLLSFQYVGASFALVALLGAYQSFVFSMLQALCKNREGWG